MCKNWSNSGLIDKQLLAAWNNSLAHQILEDNFPPYDKVKVELKKLLQEIFNLNNLNP